MEHKQVVTFSLFRFKTWKNRWWGFRQMGLMPSSLLRVPGLEFSKMLGSGAGKGFSILPNFGVYGLLAVWSEEKAARDFFDCNPSFSAFRERAEYQTFFLRTIKSHGAWDGKNPFEPGISFREDLPVAVLTRATIDPRQLWRFWTFVPPVSAAIQKHQEGLILALGIGELPLIQQATFSIWQNQQAMLDYAYQSPLHQGVIRKTRELGWYKEALFARFQPFAFEGTGENLLGAFLPASNHSSATGVSFESQE